MSSHVHLMAAARDENLSGILRHFKKFTSKQIIKAIEQSNGESRKDWMLKVFKEQDESTAEIKNINFGGRITNQRNVIVQNLACKS